jgi:hypothetical protein
LGADATIHEDHFRFDGADYFRGRAGAVQLGDVGERRNPAGSPSHLAVQARLPRDKLAIERVTRIDLQGVTVRGSDVASTSPSPKSARSAPAPWRACSTTGHSACSSWKQRLAA